MWVEKKKTGKYLFREKFIDNLTEKERTVSVTFEKNTRETRSQAQKILLSKVSKLQHDDSRTLKIITFGELVSKWQHVYNRQVATSTAYTVKGNIKLILEMFGTTTIATNISINLIRDKFEELMLGERDISVNYAHSIKTRLNSIFEYAIDHSYLKENPISRFHLPKKKEMNKAITEFFLEEDDLNNCMSYLKAHNWRYWVICEWLYLNGLRYSEAAGMLKSDVIITDERQYLEVNGALDYAGKKGSDIKKLNQTKTRSSFREVDINSRAVEIYYYACELSRDSEYLFTTSTGTPIHVSSINTYLREHKQAMGIDERKKLSTHIFRHTHVSKLAELDVPLHIIQKRVGHANENITRDIYLHITARAKDKTRKLLELI